MHKIIKTNAAEGAQALRIGCVALAAIAALTLSPLASAQESGMRVAKDPVTGKVRALTAEEAAALDAADAVLKTSKAGRAATKAAPKEVRYPDGTVSIETDESSYVYSVATRAADGSVNMQCIQGLSLIHI